MSFEKLSSKMQVNKKLLPIKGHYFFFNAGTAPLVPYLSTYARQLGFSSTTVGLIYTILPISGLIAKPLFGVIADSVHGNSSRGAHLGAYCRLPAGWVVFCLRRLETIVAQLVAGLCSWMGAAGGAAVDLYILTFVFKIQKSLFLLFQVVTIISFAAIYFIPGGQAAMNVGLDCNYGVTVLRSCYKNISTGDLCKVDAIGNKNETTLCQMNCNMSSPKMWQTVCEHWHIPTYCYSSTDSIEFTTYLNKVTTKGDCGYISTDNVTFDGYSYTPNCRTGDDYVDINSPCKINCRNAQVSEALGGQDMNMTCVDHKINYQSCNNASQLEMLSNYSLHSSSCEVLCELDQSSPWTLMEICEGWNADAAESCKPHLESVGRFPANLSFTGAVRMSTAIAEHNCLFMELNHIILPDGQIRYPYCVSKPKYQVETELFQTSCEISCDNELVNEVFMGAYESTKEETSQFTRQFWLFFMMMIISWVGQAVVVTFADALCFNLLGTKVSLYGKQRLWGSVGWGIFSLLTGTLIDLFSSGAVKDYTVAFVLMFVFMTGDVIVSSFLKIESTKMSISILADVGTLVSSVPTFVYLLWTIAVGLCTGLQWQFLFWLLEDVSAASGSCDSSDYIKTLQGLVSAIQTFCGEIPFLFVSGYLLRKVGHINMMSLILFAFGVRFVLYSFLSNPWWVLPIEILQGITSGMFYPTMTSYASIVSPPGTETTVQGLVGAVFEGVGTSLGSFIGGRLYETYGGWKTFGWFGYSSLFFCLVHVVGQHIIKKKIPSTGVAQGYVAVIRYELPADRVYMLDDMQDSTIHDT